MKLRFGLRSLLLLMLLASVVLTLWTRVVRPYSDQASAVAWLRKLGGEVKVAAAIGPAWRRWLVDTMAGQGAFCEVTDLTLTGVDLPDDTANRLSSLRFLERAHLDRTDFDAADATGLAGMTRLETLSARYTGLDDRAASVLAALPSLRLLRATSTGLTDAGLAQLATAPSLEEVYARWTGVTAAGAAAFRDAKPECLLHTHELAP